MKLKRVNMFLAFVLVITILLAACREDQETGTPLPFAAKEGLYILNEGLWNANNASLDFWDAGSGEYSRGVFARVNPGAVLGLGELGNDIGIYGSKLYLVISGSGKVEVLDATGGKLLKTIPFVQPRYITFANGRAYVSAYGGSAATGEGTGQGIVAEIDTSTLEVTRRVTVGRQPEELAATTDKLYVANSGGLTAANYERSVSVVRLTDFTREADIPVAINLHRLKADGKGYLYVNSRGDYKDIPPKLFVIDTGTGEVIDSIAVPVSNFVIANDIAYVLGMTYSAETNSTVYGYYKVDTRARSLLAGSFITDGSENGILAPYGIAVHPLTGDIYVTDARTYDVDGRIFRFSSSGKKLGEHVTGVIPAHLVFKMP